jgi:SNF2 family DNA or RNA helicase
MHEFETAFGADERKLVALTEALNPEKLALRYGKAHKTSSQQFWASVENSSRYARVKEEVIAEAIEIRSKIFPLLVGKNFVEMRADGSPDRLTMPVMPGHAEVIFRFDRRESETEYKPLVLYKGESVDLFNKSNKLLANEPAWMLIAGKVYRIGDEVDGNKLKPFFGKRNVVIPKKMEPTYYKNFMAPLIEKCTVEPTGFSINEVVSEPDVVLEVLEPTEQTSSLFEVAPSKRKSTSDRLDFVLNFQYSDFKVHAGQSGGAVVKFDEDSFNFIKVTRDQHREDSCVNLLDQLGLKINKGIIRKPRGEAFAWLNENNALLKKAGIKLQQQVNSDKNYFFGKPSLEMDIRENNDWFDVRAVIQFGKFQIPFLRLRKLIKAEKREFELPDGTWAIIPEEWIVKYADLFQFVEEGVEEGRLRKHHFAVVQDLQQGSLARVTMNRKLERLRNYENGQEYEMPNKFDGTLRTYQKAGYNWLCFLSENFLGGCLADDMGLGKTVQTLALLQREKEGGQRRTSLLVMPTSLLYNWENEARRFTPNMRILNYTGPDRTKRLDLLGFYDLVLTSYGTVRQDIDLFQQFYFHYIILDESQLIKNPASGVAKAVHRLKSRKKLILTGTPVENTTLDLWSQMHFVNPGLLGSLPYFKKYFQVPIEKKNDPNTTQRLHTLTKPFILRRLKSQVATELPGKVEMVQYSDMSVQQEKLYEKVKSSFRNALLENVEKKGLSSSQLMILQGLSKLRQLANHPQLTEQGDGLDSGKFDDVITALESVVSEGHKVLVFSSFVKHLKLFRDYSDSVGMKYSYLAGTTKDRQKVVNSFLNEKDRNVFYISLKAGGLGLNLTAADYVFILDPWWNPAAEQQAIDRAYRIGQENKVFIYKFISRNTVEEKILALQKRKQRLVSDLISSEEQFIKTLSREDIDNLFA